MTDEELEQYLEDEKLAVFLQNEEFIRELKHNAEFVQSLEADAAHVTAEQGVSSSLSPSSASGAVKKPYDDIKVDETLSAKSLYDNNRHRGANDLYKSKVANISDDVAFKQKLKHMSKSTKKKFGRMANKFSKIRRTPMGKRGAKSNFSPLEEEHEYNLQLDNTEDDDDGEEEDQEPWEPYEPSNDNEKSEGMAPHKDIQEGESSNRRRRLPLPPGAPIPETKPQDGGTEEPIVFYSEDNEFSYKNE